MRISQTTPSALRAAGPAGEIPNWGFQVSRPLAWLRRTLASIELTILCLGLLMALVTACTLAQVRLGTYAAVQAYMRSLFVYWTPPGTPWNIPIFPGGGLVGGLLLLNLTVSQLLRLERSWRKAGIWLIHIGLILLFLGEFGAALFQVDAQMPIEVGATRDFTESPREVELAVVDTTDPRHDEVTSIPDSLLSLHPRIEHPNLPFTILVKRHYPNSELVQRPPGDSGPPSLATAGPGTRLGVFERPALASDEERNQVSAFVEIINGDRSLGAWLVSTGLEAPGNFSYMDREYQLALRPKRRYLPFSLTLKEFKHDVYPGTDIPKNFSSLVRLSHPEKGEDRDALIYMNHPLRYGGKAFYQASFGKNDTLSVLQVVENPSWLLPYVSCALVSLGLLWHFLLRLRSSWRTDRA